MDVQGFRLGRALNLGVLLGYWGYIGVMLGLFWDNGKENGNYYSILRLHRA